jgi:hypothetical protein
MGQGNSWNHASHNVGQYSFPVNKACCVPAVKACRGSGAVALFVLNLALGEICGVLYAPATLPLGKTLDLHRKLCGPHSQLDILEEGKSLGTTGI